MGRRKSAILAVILGFTFLNAEQVEITSNDFFADENKQTSEFIGNVNIKRVHLMSLRQIRWLSILTKNASL